MNRKFKAVLSVVLSLLMLVSVSLPAFAADIMPGTGSQVPIIFIRGDGESIYDKDNNELANYTDIYEIFESRTEDEEGKQNVYESVANVLLPFLIEGLGTGNYDKYYEKLYEEIAELFEDMLLDKDGNASNGTGISNERKAEMAENISVNKRNWRGYYRLSDYRFWYDWRLDPLATADELHAYIQAIKKVTGCPKVALVGRCLGTTIVTAYLAKYGTDDIHSVCMNVSVANGAELFSEAISGKFKLDADAINRFVLDCQGYGNLALDSFANVSLDLLAKSGVLETVANVTKETIYYTVIKGVTSALALSTLATWPSFWSTVKEEDYDNALEYVFGSEGSEKRTEYAGLIEKIENYNVVVRENMDEILLDANENVNFSVVCKYGSQIVPVVESRNAVADQYASLTCSSYGATTSDIYTTLSDDYIAARIAEGKGKYIAPDKQVDASTCLFPDQTWFIKGNPHSRLPEFEENLLYTLAAQSGQATVDDFDFGQFIAANYQAETFEKMTEENCDTYFWKADKEQDEPSSHGSRLLVFLTAFFNWLTELFKKFDIHF